MRQPVALRQVADMKHDSPASTEPTIQKSELFKCRIFLSAKISAIRWDHAVVGFICRNSKKARPVDTNTKRILIVILVFYSSVSQ